MAVSQNGWPALTTAPAGKLPWITGRVLSGDVYTVFDYLCRRFNAEVERIKPAESWGWAYRDIRGATTLSNHASGTAIDLNAPDHPLGAIGTFDAPQRFKIRAIQSDLGGVVRWGGDYTGRKDEMHFEIVGTPAQVANVAKKLAGTPAPVPSSDLTSGTPPQVLKRGSKGDAVKRLQMGGNKFFPAYCKLAVDGDYGAATEAFVKEFQRRSGLTVDGIVGAATLAALAKHGIVI